MLKSGVVGSNMHYNRLEYYTIAVNQSMNKNKEEEEVQGK